MAKPPIIDDEPNDEPARYHPPGGSQAGGPVVSGTKTFPELARERAENARAEGTATARVDAQYFDIAANMYEALDRAASGAGFQYMTHETRSVIDAALAKARGEA